MRKEGGKWQRMELYQCINPMQSAISFYLVGDLSAKSCRWKNRVKFRLSRYFAQGRGLSSFSNWKRNKCYSSRRSLEHFATIFPFSQLQVTSLQSCNSCIRPCWNWDEKQEKQKLYSAHGRVKKAIGQYRSQIFRKQLPQKRTWKKPNLYLLFHSANDFSPQTTKITLKWRIKYKRIPP